MVYSKIKICKKCGKNFTAKGPKQELCYKCRLVEKTCTKCGAKFKTTSDNTTLCYNCRQEVEMRLGEMKVRNGYRPCHDCGRLITDYRCPACWDKWKRKHGVYVKTTSYEE